MNVSAVMFCIDGLEVLAEAAVVLRDAQTADMPSRRAVTLIAITASVATGSSGACWYSRRNVTDCTGGCDGVTRITCWAKPWWSRREEVTAWAPLPMAPATAAGGSGGASASAAFQWSRSAISNACEWWASSAERLNLTPVKVRLTASELVVPALAGSGVGAGDG